MKLPLKRTKLILFGQEMNNRKNTAGEGHCLLIFIPTSQLWWHTFHLPVLHWRCSFSLPTSSLPSLPSSPSLSLVRTGHRPLFLLGRSSSTSPFLLVRNSHLKCRFSTPFSQKSVLQSS